MPPSVILKKAKSLVLKKINTGKSRKSAYMAKTYYDYKSIGDMLGNLSNSGQYFAPPDIAILKKYQNEIFALANNFIAHRFNLLGSGWVAVSPDCQCPGFEGYNYSGNAGEYEGREINHYNTVISDEIAGLIKGDYKPIDWQLDFRSGYRWDEETWHKDIEYGSVTGADIKIPWELGRMQHLVILAYAFMLAGTDKRVFAAEFENQVLDFIAHNPPEFGVQWMTSMDVAIRAVNWLVCWDFFIGAGHKFPESFKKVFWESIYMHGKFIANHLEWSDGMRANHYLANITGLLAIAAYLPPDDEINIWLGFAMQEFEKESMYQFYPDGGNFEASAAYHLLSSEFVLFSFLITLKLGGDKSESLKSYISALWKQTPKLELPAKRKYRITQNNSIVFANSLIDRIISVFNFGAAFIKENGTIDQIGDNDGGRLLKLSTADFESSVNKRWYLSLAAGLKEGNIPESAEESFISQFLENYRLRYDSPFTVSQTDTDSLTGVSMTAFKDSGIYIYTTRYYRAVLRCGKIGQNGKGGHSHNDQLSLLLSVKGNDFFIDPGTYNYTAMPALRNKFRSTEYHNTLVLPGHEQNGIPTGSKDGLFWLMGEGSKANVLKATEQGFIGEHFGFRASHRRTVNFELNSIAGFDYCNIGIEKKVHFYLAPEVEIDDNERKSVFQRITLKNGSSIIELSTSTDIFEIKQFQYSPEYGVKRDASVIALDMKGISSSWNIEIISV